MSVEKLKAWMEKHGKTVVDVASLTKIHPNTVNRYLRGEAVHRSTEAALERLVREVPGKGEGPPEAA